MRILDLYIAKEEENVEWLQEQICNPFQERADTAMRLQESMIRLQNLRELREKLKVGKTVIQARKYGHVPPLAGVTALDPKSEQYLTDLRKRLSAGRDDCNDLKQSMRNQFAEDSQSAFMEAKGLK